MSVISIRQNHVKNRNPYHIFCVRKKIEFLTSPLNICFFECCVIGVGFKKKFIHFILYHKIVVELFP